MKGCEPFQNGLSSFTPGNFLELFVNDFLPLVLFFRSGIPVEMLDLLDFCFSYLFSPHSPISCLWIFFIEDLLELTLNVLSFFFLIGPHSVIIIFYLWGCQYALLNLLSSCVMFSSPSLFFFGLLCYRLSLAVWRSLMVCLNFENWILKRVCFVRWVDWAFLSRFPMPSLEDFPLGLVIFSGENSQCLLSGVGFLGTRRGRQLESLSV